MKFSGALLFYRWTPPTPWGEAPPVVQRVIANFAYEYVNLRIPHRVTIKDAQDEGTDCALVNLWGVDDWHRMMLHEAFKHGPLDCRIDPRNGLPASAVAFLPDGGPLIDPGRQEMELMDLVQARDHSTLAALHDLVLRVGFHIHGPKQKRRWRSDASQLMAAKAQAAVDLPLSSMKFPLASVEFLALQLREYHLCEAELAARCTADSGEGAREACGRLQCALLQAIQHLTLDLMQVLQGQRQYDIQQNTISSTPPANPGIPSGAMYGKRRKLDFHR